MEEDKNVCADLEMNSPTCGFSHHMYFNLPRSFIHLAGVDEQGLFCEVSEGSVESQGSTVTQKGIMT